MPVLVVVPLVSLVRAPFVVGDSVDFGEDDMKDLNWDGDERE